MFMLATFRWDTFLVDTYKRNTTSLRSMLLVQFQAAAVNRIVRSSTNGVLNWWVFVHSYKTRWICLTLCCRRSSCL